MKEKKVTKEMIEEMKKMRKEGYTFKEIAEKFGTTPSNVQYHLSDRLKVFVKRRVVRCYDKNKKKFIERNKEWRKKNKDKYKKSVCFSLLKSLIKDKIVTKQDVLDFIEQIGGGGNEKENG